MQLCRHWHFSSSVFPNMPVRNLFVSSFFPFLFLFASCSIETFPSVFPRCTAKRLSVLHWNLQLCASTENSARCAHLCNCCMPFVHSMLAPTRYNKHLHPHFANLLCHSNDPLFLCCWAWCAVETIATVATFRCFMPLFLREDLQIGRLTHLT